MNYNGMTTEEIADVTLTINELTQQYYATMQVISDRYAATGAMCDTLRQEAFNIRKQIEALGGTL